MSASGMKATKHVVFDEVQTVATNVEKAIAWEENLKRGDKKTS